MPQKTIVMVTGVGGGGTGHELIKTLRLADHYWIIGVDMTAASLGLSDVDESFLVPPASDPQYVNILLDICKRKRVMALFPGSEPELMILSKNRAMFSSISVFLPMNSVQVIERGLDKWATMTYLKDHGFPIPQTQLLKSADEIPGEFLLPAVVKPAVGGGGSNNTFLVQDIEELTFACGYLVRQGKIVLLQEYVGTPEDEYTVGVLNTLDGAFLGSIALRRDILGGLSNRIKMPNRTGRRELSPTLAISSGVSQGVIADFPEVRKACEAIADALQSQGPLNIQGRFVNGAWYTFEINPRFSGTSYMRALMGFNEPDLLICHHLLGQQIASPVQYKFGQVVRGLREQVVDASLAREAWSLQS
jgi:carbamoyl-phosphate synthase large subunit